MKKSIFTNNLSLLVIAFLGIIYIFLPSTNNSSDSIAYAIDIRNGDIFSPHHLLFNALGFAFSKILHTNETLAVNCVINALFAIGCLWWVRKISLYFVDDKSSAFILFFLGSCFGFLRFATDGETYIIPIFFSLWASFTLLKKQIFVTGLLASIACLFHQIHFFWWFGLLWCIWVAYPNERTKNLVLYIGTAFIVPIAYILVFYLTRTDCDNLLQYIFHDYVKSSHVEFKLKGIAFLLTPISFIRTFIQVHGYMYPLIMKNLWLILILSVIAFFSFMGIKSIKGGFINNHNDIQIKNYASAHLLIFFFQLSYAFISDGNAEFMVMLPFVLSIFLFTRFQIRSNIIGYLSITLFLWNISFGVIPNHFVELDSDMAFKNYMTKNPNLIYLVRDNPRIENLIAYFNPHQKIILLDAIKDKSKLDRLISSKKVIYSDIWYNKGFISREKVVDRDLSSIEKNFSITYEDSLKYDLGILYISKICNKLPLK